MFIHKDSWLDLCDSMRGEAGRLHNNTCPLRQRQQVAL